MGEQSNWREHPDTCRCELDGQWKAVHSLANLGNRLQVGFGRVEGRINVGSAPQEQVYCREIGERITGWSG
jgi:hypothetical protein